MKKFVTRNFIFIYVFLTCYSYNISSTAKATEITFKGHKIKIDEKNALLYKELAGKKIPLNIEYDTSLAPKRFFLIYDLNPPAAGFAINPLSTKDTTEEEIKKFDDIVSTYRLLGINTMKTQNTQCYEAYAEERLGKDYKSKIDAMDRENNPRPLAFETDEDWNEFKEDLEKAFALFKSPNAYLVIVGTSTTFFSANPRKGKNQPLFEKAPACIERAKDPVRTKDIYTFDTPGSEISDIDIHVLIPELSELCEEANVLGNNGTREVYYENTFDKCLRISPDNDVRELVKFVPEKIQTLHKAAIPDEALGQFFAKWGKKLNRPINFSVNILPSLRKGILYEPGQNDFNNDPYLKKRFLIPIR
jgi:hypothetical protein